MLKKTITFTNFADEEETEDFYFHLSEADLAEMQLRHNGALDAYLERITKAEDGNAIMDFFAMLIEKSYGKKSEDGKRFLKTPEIWQEFRSSVAYNELFMELITDAEKGAEFFNGITPAEALEKRFGSKGTPKGMPPVNPEIQKARDEAAARRQELGIAAAGPRQLTKAEVEEMDSDELKNLLATGQAVIGQA